ncbi:MAG: putative Enoyl-CoA hydratase, partial [Gammaproteobacteria bacterium]|nr:putative Enoyl-CoA hydratase [Gammaproteobacteria bacterium]
MMEQILVATTNFRVDIDAGGIAHVVFQPAGGMPVLDMDGHRALAGIWRQLDEHAAVKVILVESEGKGFCAGGDMAMVENMLDSPPVR